MDKLSKHLCEVVDKTWNHAGHCHSEKDHIQNAVLGLVGEAGEVADIIKKTYYHKAKERRTELLLEMGDVMYYYLKLADLYGFTLDEILQANRNKLFERYEVDTKPTPVVNNAISEEKIKLIKDLLDHAMDAQWKILDEHTDKLEESLLALK